MIYKDLPVTVSRVQAYVIDLYYERGFTSDPHTLLMGLMEEVGELARAVNEKNILYVKRPGTKKNRDSIEHEIKDVFVYLFALCNAYNINAEELLIQEMEKLSDE